MLLIKGGNIIDGTGKPAYKADILISQDKISAIGIFPKKDGVQTINALGLNVVPGFIDVHTTVDHDLTLFTDPVQQNYLLQGVTTIIGGHCGSSLAPLLYGSLESMRKWADPFQINVNWHSLKDFFATLSARKLGVNFGTLVGHSTIRRALIGEDVRDLTDEELKVFKSILTTALEEGALGLSSGLGYAHSYLVPYAEMAIITKVVAKFGGVYSTHLRNEKNDLEKSIKETISLAEENKLNTLISHLKPFIGFEQNIKMARYLFNILDKNVNLNFCISPFSESVVPLYALLPKWACRGNLESMLAKLRIQTSFLQIKAALPNFNLASMVITNAPFNKYLIGKKLSDYALEKQLEPKEAVMYLMLATSLRANIAIADINLPIAEDMLFDSRAFVGSSNTSLDNQAFIKYLELAKKDVGLTLENAIKKVTSLPAKKMGIKNRGVLKEGSFADIVLMQDHKVQHVLVNGALSVQDNQIKNILSGRILKK